MKQYLFLATALLGLAACNETESLSGYDGQVELRFTSGIDVQTRSSHGLDTQLKDGETVHLWIDDSKNRQQTIDQENLYENILLTKEGGAAGTLSGSTPMYFPLTGNDVNIYALHTNATWFGNTYPARSLTHTVAADQRSETDGYATSDLTYAKLTGVSRSGNPTSVAVQFRHLLSKIEVILKKGVGENDFLAGITKVEILNTLPQAQFTLDKEKHAYGKNTELPDGIEITADGPVQNITIDTDITAEGATSILNEAIIVPQTIEAGTAFIKITLAAGGEFVYKMKDGGTTFESGKKYRYTITANQTAIEVSSSIHDWDEGVGDDDGIAVIPPPIGNITDRTQTQVGDLAMEDGTFVRTDDYTTLTDEQKKACVGIVFWTYSDTYPKSTLTNDKVLMADYPDCTHGLIVALKDAATGKPWQSASTTFRESVTTWQETATFDSKYTQIAPISPVDETLDSEAHKLLGYNNTMVLLAYNSDPAKILYRCQAAQSIKTFADNNITPKGCSSWYFPSLKELALLCDEDSWKYPLPSYGTTDTSNKGKINDILNALSDNDIDTEILARFSWGSDFYNSLFSLHQLRDHWNKYIGVGISFPILSGLDRYAGVKKKKLNLQRVRNNIEEEKLHLRNETEQIVLSLHSGWEEHRQAVLQVKAETQVLKETERKWEEGLVSVFQLMEARNRLLAAKAEKIRVRLQYELTSRLAMYYQTGSFINH